MDNQDFIWDDDTDDKNYHLCKQNSEDESFGKRIGHMIARKTI